MKRYYIGLASSFHDPAMAIVDGDGQLLFAEGSERHLQDKRGFGSAPDHVFRCEELLREFCSPDADYVVALSWEKTPLLMEAMGFLVSRFPAWAARSMPPEVPRTITQQVAAGRRAGFNLMAAIRETSPRSMIEVRHCDHHTAHALAGVHTSPFTDASVVIADGYGQRGSFSYFRHRGAELDLVTHVRAPLRASLGQMYIYLTSMCGFSAAKGEEWKVMGLAAYGQLHPRVYELFRSLFAVDGLGLAHRGGGRTKEHLRELRRYARKPGASALTVADVAYTGQLVFCEAMTAILRNFHELAPSRNLVLGGGCALNSSFAGQVLGTTPFENLHVPSAPADDGNAIGAAFSALRADRPGRVWPSTGSPYLGSTISADSLQRFSRFCRIPKLQHLPQTLPETVADLLARGRIVAWAQGRSEFGPRALGNRSILADPRPPGMKDRINELVKFREEFRPFAPSILHEFGDEYFENYQESRYMERTLRFRDDAAKRVPAVVHVDQTGRLQTVKRDWNEKFHSLVSAFHRRTGVPLVLNTSFNVMGKPIVHSVEDAIAVFYTSGIDALAVGDYLIEK